MALIAIAQAAHGIRWTDGRSVDTAASLEVLLDQLDRPHGLICEPSFYDDLHEVRRHLETWLAEQGHRLIPVTRSIKEVLTAVGGTTITGRGVARLFALATIASRQLRPIGRDQDPHEVRAVLQLAHLLDLYDEEASVLEDALMAAGPFAALDGSSQAALGEGASYQPDVLLAVYRVALVATSRDAFDRLLGLTATAHGPLIQTIRAWYVERNTREEFVRGAALSWNDYRRALRRLFHRIVERRRSSCRLAAA